MNPETILTNAILVLPDQTLNGTIVLRPKTRRLADLVGILTQPGQPGVSVDEMRLPE